MHYVFFPELNMKLLLCRELLEKQNTVEQSLVPAPMDSFDFSSQHSSSNCNKVALLPLKLDHDLDHAYVTHGA
jgi:hypothetical protein